ADRLQRVGDDLSQAVAGRGQLLLTVLAGTIRLDQPLVDVEGKSHVAPNCRSAPRARSRVNHGMRGRFGARDGAGATRRGSLSRGFARVARSYGEGSRVEPWVMRWTSWVATPISRSGRSKNSG